MANSQYSLTPAQEMARALNAKFPAFDYAARYAAIEDAVTCPECGEVGGLPIPVYLSGDDSVGYGGETIEACTLCVGGLKAVR